VGGVCLFLSPSHLLVYCKLTGADLKILLLPNNLQALTCLFQIFDEQLLRSNGVFILGEGLKEKMLNFD
jgi:hypothetical protein